MRFFVKWGFVVLAFVMAFSLCCTPLAQAEEVVYLGGVPLAISVNTQGLSVLGLCEVETADGEVSPAKEAGVAVGDLIRAIDGRVVNSREDVQKALDDAQGHTVTLAVERDGRSTYLMITPRWDVAIEGWRLGMYLKDSVDGIGTLTFVQGDRFGALGHCITTGGESDPMPISGGEIYSTTVASIVKGKSGSAGSLVGGQHAKDKAGEIESNTVFGVFGRATPALVKGLKPVAVANPKSVHKGQAHIYTTVDETGPHLYEVEITDVKRSRKPDVKGISLKVVDPALIELTGGIVQGMSGSPILQDGRLVGAVTHVVVADPTLGYGVFAQYMLGR
ncbi:MAG: PDZ domain-containing protein [Clostridia bacterium]|nr:PDZ domain-containing protein [Clostridia bacterium]